MTHRSYQDHCSQNNRAENLNDDAGMKDSHDPEVDRHGQHGASSVGLQEGDGGKEDSSHSGADPWTKGGEGTAATPNTVTKPPRGQWTSWNQHCSQTRGRNTKPYKQNRTPRQHRLCGVWELESVRGEAPTATGQVAITMQEE